MTASNSSFFQSTVTFSEEKKYKTFRYAINYCRTNDEELRYLLIQGVTGITLDILSILSAVILIYLWSKHKRTSQSVSLIILSAINICYSVQSTLHHGMPNIGGDNPNNLHFKEMVFPNMKLALEMLESTLYSMYAWFMVMLSQRSITLSTSTPRLGTERITGAIMLLNSMMSSEQTWIVTMLFGVAVFSSLMSLPPLFAWNLKVNWHPCRVNRRVGVLHLSDRGDEWKYRFLYRQVLVPSLFHGVPMVVILISTIIRFIYYRKDRGVDWATGRTTAKCGKVTATYTSEPKDNRPQHNSHNKRLNSIDDNTTPLSTNEQTFDNSDRQIPESKTATTTDNDQSTNGCSCVPPQMVFITCILYLPLSAFACYERLSLDEDDIVSQRIAHMVQSTHIVAVVAMTFGRRQFRQAVIGMRHTIHRRAKKVICEKKLY